MSSLLHCTHARMHTCTHTSCTCMHICTCFHTGPHIYTRTCSHVCVPHTQAHTCTGAHMHTSVCGQGQTRHPLYLPSLLSHTTSSACPGSGGQSSQKGQPPGILSGCPQCHPPLLVGARVIRKRGWQTGVSWVLFVSHTPSRSRLGDERVRVLEHVPRPSTLWWKA